MTNLKITPEQLAKFKKICQKYGFNLDDAATRQQALKLLNLIAITRRPLPRSYKNDSFIGKSQSPTSGRKEP